MIIKSKSPTPKSSPVKFFLIVYGLSILFWLIETMIDVKSSSLDFSATDILAAFTPLIAPCILISTKKGVSALINILKE